MNRISVFVAGVLAGLLGALPLVQQSAEVVVLERDLARAERDLALTLTSIAEHKVTLYSEALSNSWACREMLDASRGLPNPKPLPTPQVVSPVVDFASWRPRE